MWRLNKLTPAESMKRTRSEHDVGCLGNSLNPKPSCLQDCSRCERNNKIWHRMCVEIAMVIVLNAEKSSAHT